MILIYTSRKSNRLSFIASHLFGRLMGFECAVTDDRDAFCSFQGPKLNYSDEGLKDIPFIRPSGLLFESGIRKDALILGFKEEEHLMFPQSDPQALFPVDIFSAVFYFLSLYDEYINPAKDEHGRLPARESLAYRLGWLEKAIVNRWAADFSNTLQQHFTIQPDTKKDFRFIPSLDIDQPFEFLYKGWQRNLGGFAKDLIKGRFAAARERMLVLGGKQRDAFDTFEEIFKIHESRALQPHFFVLCGRHGKYDKNINPGKPAFKKMVNLLACHGHVGIHPSYASFLKPHRIREEMELLGSMANVKISMNRQHFLRLRVPESFRIMLNLGIREDYSLGFSDLPGFRAGTCEPFPFYDLEMERETELTLFPFAFMDGTLRDHLGLDPEAASQKISQLTGEVRMLKACLVSLWHNESLSEQGRWTGWRSIYKQLLDEACS